MHDVHQIPDWNRDAETVPELGEVPCIHETATVIRSRMGGWVEIGPYAEIIESAIGDYSYVAGVHTSITYAEIGKFCSIASSVRINPVNHPTERVMQHHATYRRRQYGFDSKDDADIFALRKRRSVRIGHDVWVGHGATVMSGLTIGTGAVIGSGAVVTRDVEPFTIVVGVPARPLRKRFTEPVMEKLLASRWWDWSHAELKERFDLLLDPERFLAAIPTDDRANIIGN